MSLQLPASIHVLERGWLSANNILFLEGENATLVDSGYVTHAAQTVELVGKMLDGRRLKRLINTHSHSDHIGGNAALKSAYGCEIIVPAGLHAAIADWDENALLLSPLGQQSARFQHDSLLGANNEIEMGGLNWQTLAVPGHDMEALGYYNPEKRILISGDAILAAQAMGADFAYIGSAFIATEEARASDAYKQAIVDGNSDDIVYSNLFTGVHGNYLAPSIRAAGMDPDHLPESDPSKMNFGGDAKKAWKDIWGCGQGIGAVTEITSAAVLVDRLRAQYRAARARLVL